MSDRIKVGMANWKLAGEQDVLVTFGLGSCVGLGLWNAQAKIAAMAHIMLPDSRQLPYRQENPAKFADTALQVMLEKFAQLSIPKESLQAKIVGGANMFNFAGRPAMKEGVNIGQRNIAAVKERLRLAGIPILGEDTGGSVGRSVEFFAHNGVMKVRTALTGEREI